MKLGSTRCETQGVVALIKTVRMLDLVARQARMGSARCNLVINKALRRLKVLLEC